MTLPNSSKTILEVCVLAVVVVALFFTLNNRDRTDKAVDVSLFFNAPLSKLSKPQFQPQVSTSDVTNPFVNLCGVFTTSTIGGPTPFVIGISATNTTALVVDTTCTSTVNGVAYAANTPVGIASSITVFSRSYLSFSKIAPGSRGFLINGSLTVQSGAYIDAMFGTGFSTTAITTLDLIFYTATTCTSISSVSPNITGCPSGASCSWIASGTAPSCKFSVVVNFVITATFTTSQYWNLVLNKDCTKYTTTMFLNAIQSTLNIDPGLLVLAPFYCGSLWAAFQCKGISSAAATATCTSIFNAATTAGSALNTQLGVLYGFAGTGTPSRPSGSSSNKALYGLLALLFIPVAAIIALIVWMMKKKSGDSPKEDLPKSMDPYGAESSHPPAPQPTTSPVISAPVPLVNLNARNIATPTPSPSDTVVRC